MQLLKESWRTSQRRIKPSKTHYCELYDTYVRKTFCCKKVIFVYLFYPYRLLSLHIHFQHYHSHIIVPTWKLFLSYNSVLNKDIIVANFNDRTIKSSTTASLHSSSGVLLKLMTRKSTVFYVWLWIIDHVHVVWGILMIPSGIGRARTCEYCSLLKCAFWLTMLMCSLWMEVVGK